MALKQITFRIERDVILDPLWFDQQWYDELRAEGLSHEDALRHQVEIGLQEDPLSVLWESFEADSSDRRPSGRWSHLANEFASSITRIDLVGG